MYEAKEACLYLGKSGLPLQKLMSKMQLNPDLLSSTSIPYCPFPLSCFMVTIPKKVPASAMAFLNLPFFIPISLKTPRRNVLGSQSSDPIPADVQSLRSYFVILDKSPGLSSPLMQRVG